MPTLLQADSAMVALCRDWIEAHAQPRKTMNPKAFAYALKHEVERWRPNTYVTESAFRIAALSLGYGDGPVYRMRLRPRNRGYVVRRGESFFLPLAENAAACAGSSAARGMSVEKATALLSKERRTVLHVLDRAVVRAKPPTPDVSAWDWFYGRLSELTGCGTADLHCDTFVGKNVMRDLLKHQRRYLRLRNPAITGAALTAAVNWSNMDSGPLERIGSRMRRLEPNAVIITSRLP